MIRRSFKFIVAGLFSVGMVSCSQPNPFYQGISTQWPPIENTYKQYVNNDTSLSPAIKQDLLNSATVMDQLITAEAAREAAAANPFAPSTQPATVTPVTVPGTVTVGSPTLFPTTNSSLAKPATK